MPQSNDTPTPEAAVRLYLMYLENPSSLRDEAEIQRLQDQADKARDPIDKALILSTLERAEAVDATSFEQGFIDNAKTWAEQESVSTNVLRKLGVSDDLLRRAGFDVGTRRGPRKTASGSAPRQRAKSVPIDTIKDHVRSLKGTFLLNDVSEGAGGSTATVRKAVDELIEANEVEKLGPVTNYGGRGRAPMQYSRS